MMNGLSRIGLSGNGLKMLACVCMLADHAACLLLTGPTWLFLRYIGRLAFPVFAFFIAEGCRYTRRKGTYLGLIAVMGATMALVQFLATGRYYGNIFLTFSLAIPTVYLAQWLKRQLFSRPANRKGAVGPAVVLAVWLPSLWLFNRVLPVDYGFFGILLPLAFSLPTVDGLPVSPQLRAFDTLRFRLAFGAGDLLLISAFSRLPYQWLCLLALPLLALYNGQRGKRTLKYFFYAFYPLHIAALYGLRQLSF